MFLLLIWWCTSVQPLISAWFFSMMEQHCISVWQLLYKVCILSRPLQQLYSRMGGLMSPDRVSWLVYRHWCSTEGGRGTGGTESTAVCGECRDACHQGTKIVWSHLYPCWYNFSHGVWQLKRGMTHVVSFPIRFSNYFQLDSQTIPNLIPKPFPTWFQTIPNLIPKPFPTWFPNYTQPDSYTISNQTPKPFPRHSLKLTDLKFIVKIV